MNENWFLVFFKFWILPNCHLLPVLQNPKFYLSECKTAQYMSEKGDLCWLRCRMLYLQLQTITRWMPFIALLMSLMSPLPLHTVFFSGWVKDPDETGHKKCCNPWILDSCDKWLEFCWHTIHPLFAWTSSTPLSWCMYGWPLPLAVAGWQLLMAQWWAGCWVCWAPIDNVQWHWRLLPGQAGTMMCPMCRKQNKTGIASLCTTH